MQIRYSPSWFGMGVLGLAAGLWLVFWAPDSLTPSARYLVGSLLLASGSVSAALQLSVRPRGAMEERTAPAELNAWISLACVSAITLYLLFNTSVLAGIWSGRDVQQMSIKLLMIIVFWVVISAVMRARRGAAVLEDERDREIRRLAAGWGRGALLFCIFGLVLMLGLSPEQKLVWATPTVIASQLLFALMWGWCCEYAASVIYYWRDRQ